jgi:hypothetical protein
MGIEEVPRAPMHVPDPLVGPLVERQHTQPLGGVGVRVQSASLPQPGGADPPEELPPLELGPEAKFASQTYMF